MTMQSVDTSFLMWGLLTIGLALAVVFLFLRTTRPRHRTPQTTRSSASTRADTHRATTSAKDTILQDTSIPGAGENLDLNAPTNSPRPHAEPDQGEPEPPRPPATVLETPDEQREELSNALAALDATAKHRIVYRFLPHMRGILLSDDVLDGHLSDAVIRATRKGWQEGQLITAAKTGKWRRPSARHNTAEGP